MISTPETKVIHNAVTASVASPQGLNATYFEGVMTAEVTVTASTTLTITLAYELSSDDSNWQQPGTGQDGGGIIDGVALSSGTYFVPISAPTYAPLIRFPLTIVGTGTVTVKIHRK